MREKAASIDEASNPPRALRVEPTIRRPRPGDGPSVFDLVSSIPALDDNSLYCNVLQCTHFADTAAIAEEFGAVVGWVSAYLQPDAPDTLFVWQVAVRDDQRGKGIAGRLIASILELDAPWRQEAGLDRAIHFAGRHATELAFTIGPIPHRG
jgi:L-2,4-diaminobutyric acid acetyltransferase